MTDVNEMTKAELFEEARTLGLEGFTGMNKADLRYAVKHEHTRLKRAATMEAKAREEKRAARAATRAETRTQATAAPTTEVETQVESNGDMSGATRYQKTAQRTRYSR